MNSNRNRQIPRVQEEKNVIDAAHRDAHTGALIGGATAAGTASLLLKKKRLLGIVGSGALGAVSGAAAGRRIGIDRGARDVHDARKALNQQRQLAALTAEVNDLVMRQTERDALRFETVDGATAAKPVRPGQLKIIRRPSVRGQMSEPGNGRSSEAEFFSPARQAIADKWGYGIAESLEDDELDDEHAAALHDAIMGKVQKTDSPSAGVRRGEDFERGVLAQHMGARVVEAMSPAEVHAHYLGAVRKGLIELEDQGEATSFAILNRSRTPEGTFAPDDQVSSAAVRRAYSPDSATSRAASADPHTGRNAAIAGATAAAAGIGARALFKGRKGRLRLPPGVAKIAGSGAPKSFAMTSAPGPGTYPIRRAKLRGKKPPGVPKILGKKKPTNLGAFLIHDDAFPLLPQPGQKLAPGMRQRVKPARTRKEVLARLKEITQLASRHDLGLGAAVAEGAIDALGLGEATTPKRKKLMVDANGNVINPKFLPTPATTSTSSFASALRRLHEFGIGSSITSGAGRFLPEVGAIAGGDLIGESLHDRIVAARQRKAKKARMQVRGGIEAQSPPGPTTMSAILGVVQEFDYGVERTARAKRNNTTVAAAGVGAVGGALAGAYHDQGRPVKVGDLRPGDSIYRRQGIGGIFQHSGVVGEDGKVVHRSRGSSVARSVLPQSFVKGGKGPLRRESHSDDLPRAQAARNATRASGQRQGKYSIAGENCHTASTRIASKSAPHSRQLRKVIGGAAIGAAGAGAMAHILQNHKKKDQ
jgi:hypothetical protein